MTVTKEDIADARIQIDRLRESLIEIESAPVHESADEFVVVALHFISRGIYDAQRAAEELSSFIAKLST